MQSAVCATDVVTQSAVCADDIEPCANERLDRIVTGTVTVVPFLLLGVAIWHAWASLLQWHDVVVLSLIHI